MKKRRKKNRINQIRNPIKANEKLNKLIRSTETNPLVEENLEKLIRHSESSLQKNKEQNVSSFSSWVFNGIVGETYQEALKRGKDGESYLIDDIIEFKGKEYKRIDINSEKIRRDKYKFLSNNWELLFEDVSSSGKDSFEISRLKYENKSIWGKPDIIYRNQQNDIIIVEIKTTGYYTKVPKGGWFNLQCQLWAYSWIDNYQNSNNIYLYGDIRKLRTEKKGDKRRIIINPSENNPMWHIKKDGKLNKEDENVLQLHNQCTKMFNLYGGEFFEID